MVGAVSQGQVDHDFRWVGEENVPFSPCFPEQVAANPLGGVPDLGPDPAVERIGVDFI